MKLLFIRNREFRALTPHQYHMTVCVYASTDYTLKITDRVFFWKSRIYG